MKGRLKQRIFSAGMARESFSHHWLIGSAPKKISSAEAPPIKTLRRTARRRIWSADFRVPQASSSVTRRVTAVQIPEEAKVLPST